MLNLSARRQQANAAAVVFVKYRFNNTLVDLISKQSATVTRSTVATYWNSSGVPTTSAINAAAFVASELRVDRAITDYVRYGTSFDIGGGNQWQLNYGSATTGELDPLGTYTALKCTQSVANTVELFNEAVLTGGSGVGYFEIFAKSNTNWIAVQITSNFAGTNGQRIWLNLGSLTKGTTTTYGTGIATATFELSTVRNGFVRIRCVVTNTVSPTQSNLWFSVFAAASNGVLSSTTNDNFTVWELGYRDVDTSATIASSGDYSVTQGATTVSIDAAGWPVSEYAMYTDITPRQMVQGSETAYIYFAGDGSPGSTTNEVSVSYTSGVWTLLVKVGGVSYTATVALAAVKSTKYKCYWKVSAAGLYLSVNGNVGTGTGATPTYAPTTALLAYNVASCIFSNFKGLKITTLTAAQAEAA